MSGTHESGEPASGDAPAWGTPQGPAPAPPPGYGPPKRGDVTAYVVRPPTGNAKAYAQGGVIGVALTLAGFIYGYGLLSVFALLLTWPMARQFVNHRPGTVRFGVDARGVYFGGVEAGHVTVPFRDAPVRWSWIDSVVVFPVTRHRHEGDAVAYRTVTERVTAVGVTRRGAPDDRIPVYQLFRDDELDRPALERAVARFGGGVRVVDGPPVTQDDRQ